MTVDVHAHILERDFARWLARTPNPILPVSEDGDGFRIDGYGPMDPLLYDLDGRLESLRRRGVELQLVAAPPPLWSKPGWVPDLEAARVINEATRRAVAAAGGRLAGLVVAPLAESGETATAFVADLLDTPHFAGMAMPTSAAAKPLDDAGLEPLFALLSRRRVPVFMHSVTGEARAATGRYTLRTVIGWPTETAIAVARLIFAGVFERHPFPLILSHGGGTLPILAGRLDLAYGAPLYEANADCRANIARPPSSYLRELYFDTVVASAEALRFLLDFAGADHILFGSDFPYEIGDAEGRHIAPALAELPPAVRDQILRRNARRVLADARSESVLVSSSLASGENQ